LGASKSPAAASEQMVIQSLQRCKTVAVYSKIEKLA
jgi:hypothetical protein